MPLDPSLRGARAGAKAGFDLTFPFGWDRKTEFTVPEPPSVKASRNATVRDALASGPHSFLDLMEATGTRDGRDVLVEIDSVRAEGLLERLPDGRYILKGARSP